MKSVRELKIPIIQGGMGVGISRSNLAGHVAKEGAMGTIASVGIGFEESDFYTDTDRANLRILKKEIQRAKEISQGNGAIAVNVMVAVTQYRDLCLHAAQSGADALICGAGLPLDLPEIVKDYDILLCPIVSSAKALKVIVKKWKKNYDRLPDFVVIEGPKAGGHLGFKKENLDISLESILSECVEFLNSEQYDIPLFVAGGVNSYEKIAHFRNLGAFGAQIGTRFILTKECDASFEFKQKLLNSRDEDVSLIHSPVGLPGRAIGNAFTRRAQEGRIPPKRCVNCLVTCDPKTTHFCICEKLIRSVSGDVEEGLVFCSAEIGNFNEILSVKEVIRQCWKE